MLPVSQEKAQAYLVTYARLYSGVLAAAFLTLCALPPWMEKWGPSGSVLEHRAQARLQRGRGCPLHMEKSLITLSSTTANLVGKYISKPLSRIPKGRGASGAQ